KSVTSVALSPDGTQIVTGGYVRDRGAGPNQVKGEATVWDARTGAALVELKGFKGGMSSVAFSPDGTRIVTGVASRAGFGETVWDAKTGTALVEVNGLPSEVRSVAFSPDGTRFFTGLYPGRAKAWDASTGKEVPGAAIPNMKRNDRLSPDGR